MALLEQLWWLIHRFGALDIREVDIWVQPVRVKYPFELLHPFAIDEVDLCAFRLRDQLKMVSTVIHIVSTYLSTRVDPWRGQHGLGLLVRL